MVRVLKLNHTKVMQMDLHLDQLPSSVKENVKFYLPSFPSHPFYYYCVSRELKKTSWYYQVVYVKAHKYFQSG